MPRCTDCRWGTGTTREKPTVGSKEMESKFAAMQAERVKQDTLFFGAVPSQSDPNNKQGTEPTQSGQTRGQSSRHGTECAHIEQESCIQSCFGTKGLLVPCSQTSKFLVNVRQYGWGVPGGLSDS